MLLKNSLTFSFFPLSFHIKPYANKFFFCCVSSKRFSQLVADLVLSYQVCKYVHICTPAWLKKEASFLQQCWCWYDEDAVADLSCLPVNQHYTVFSSSSVSAIKNRWRKSMKIRIFMDYDTRKPTCEPFLFIHLLCSEPVARISEKSY